MAEVSRYILIFFLALGVFIVIDFTAPFVFSQFRTTDYGFTVHFVNRDEAGTGEIIHLTKGDLAGSPELVRILSGESFESPRLSEEKYHFYRMTYPNYSMNQSGSRAYYEYEGRFFYLRYRRDDVNVL